MIEAGAYVVKETAVITDGRARAPRWTADPSDGYLSRYR